MRSMRWLALPLLALTATGALAEEGPIARPELAARPASPPDLASPLRLRAGSGKLARSLWTAQGLWHQAPTTLGALRTVGRAGPPSYDPQTRAFFAAAEGTIVELRPDGALRVLVDGVQGHDLDVRARSGLAVSREPDHRIVLHRTAQAARRGLAAKQTLLSGERFFAPRLSPDGSRLLVAESRAEGGHIWLVTLDGRAADLGQGYDAVWHPDGRQIVFARIQHDGVRLTSSDLYVMELGSRRVRCLARTPGLIEVEPVLSPDGRWLAFQDARGGDLYLARYPGAR
jgi:dipeptidyl aminopeptidase/acylaminoacyl peptidase